METQWKSTPLWAWIVIAILTAHLVVGAVCYCRMGMFADGKESAPVETFVVSPPTVSPTPVQAQDSSDAPLPVAAAVAEVPSGPLYHIIAGAFAIESNADNLMAKLKREYPDLITQKMAHPQSGLNMVSIFQTSDLREASNRMNLYWDIDLYLWIYEQKQGF
jgi:hypothetical protein